MADRHCAYCGGKLGDARPTTRFHQECIREAKRMGMV